VEEGAGGAEGGVLVDVEELVAEDGDGLGEGLAEAIAGGAPDFLPAAIELGL
jgi:hypothetical protein